MSIEALSTMESYKGAMGNTQFGADLVTSTVDRLNTGKVGLTPVIDSDYAMQKTVLTGAYTDPMKGNRLDLLV